MNYQIKFKNKIYNLFVTLTFPPLYEYDYSDEYYHFWFKKLTGANHGMLDVIRSGFLYKYIPIRDFEVIKRSFERRIDSRYPKKLFQKFSYYNKKFIRFLNAVSRRRINDGQIIEIYNNQRKLGAPLDALLNVSHIFSLLFDQELRSYLIKLAGGDAYKANQWYIACTAPVKKTKLSLKKSKKTKIAYPQLSGRYKIIQSMISQGAYIKDYVEGLFFSKDKFMRRMYSRIAHILSITKNDLLYLTRDEIINCIYNGVIPDKKFISDRKKVTVFYQNRGKNFYSFEGEKADSFLENGNFSAVNYERKAVSSKGVLQGQPASIGRGRGKVRIIISRDQFKYFRRGEVLVTFYTAVEFVPLMKKAAAIVTETGGITSHTAVVSRELNKPAVIGVVNATKILKNGDLVEVDADRGIVKIVNQ